MCGRTVYLQASAIANAFNPPPTALIFFCNIQMQNVSSITLFAPENFGGETSVLHFLGFKGETTSFRHTVVDTVYESKPQPSDHKAPADKFGAGSII